MKLSAEVVPLLIPTCSVCTRHLSNETSIEAGICYQCRTRQGRAAIREAAAAEQMRCEQCNGRLLSATSRDSGTCARCRTQNRRIRQVDVSNARERRVCYDRARGEFIDPITEQPYSPLQGVHVDVASDGSNALNFDYREIEALIASNALVTSNALRGTGEQVRNPPPGIATFIRPVSGWRGGVAALYSLSADFKDYEYVVVHFLLGPEEGTQIYGADSAGHVPVIDRSIAGYSHGMSHTAALLSIGYAIMPGTETKEDVWIDKWEAGTYPTLVTVLHSQKDVWNCSCPPCLCASRPKNCSYKKRTTKILEDLGYRPLAIPNVVAEQSKRLISLED